MAAHRPTESRIVPASLLVAGSEMVSFTLIGLLIDYLSGSLPFATIVATLLGGMIAFYHLVRMAGTLTKKPRPDQ